MTNSHAAFADYLQSLNLSKTQEDRLRASRDALINKIKRDFSDKNLTQPDEESQGSYILGTQNRPKSDDYDLDHGIYLRHAGVEKLSPVGAHDLIKEIVRNHTDQPLPSKDSCVRVQYARDGDTPGHHIDLAIYRILANGVKQYAHVKDGWQQSDQKEFKEWYTSRKTDQLHNIVRLLKGWADHNNGSGDKKLPSGFHLTVLAVSHPQPIQDRDDMSLVNTAGAIAARLRNAYQRGSGDKVVRPVVPNEDLFRGFSRSRIDHSIEKFDQLVRDGQKALDEAVAEKAQTIWRDIFGDRFTVSESKKQDGRYEKFGPTIIAPSKGAG